MWTYDNIRDALVGEVGRVDSVRPGAHHPLRAHLQRFQGWSVIWARRFLCCQTIQLVVSAGPLAGLDTMVKLPGKSLVTTATCMFSKWKLWWGIPLFDTMRMSWTLAIGRDWNQPQVLHRSHSCCQTPLQGGMSCVIIFHQKTCIFFWLRHSS